jgi:hypothetical protein
MDRIARFSPASVLIALSAVLTFGCASPYHADRGALFGGLTGAGVGALVGNAAGNTAAGAAIGAGVGAMTGAAVGSEMDEMEARNRAMIQAQLGRPVAAGVVSVEDVVAITRAGVQEELIVNHIRVHGINRPLQTNDLIALQQQGVSTRVIAAMQEPPAPRTAPVPVAQPVIVEQAPPPVIVAPYDPYWHSPPCYHHGGYYHQPGVSWGVTVHD